MPGTPNEFIFARSPDGQSVITWGQVRASADPVHRLQSLALRLRGFLIAQYAELLDKNVSGPFPVSMAVMAGIGTLGEVFYATPKPADAGAENRESFRRFCVKLDQRLGRQPPLAFRTAFAERWGVDCPQSVAVILYTYFRNSLVHGYYGRTVFVTGDGTNSLHLRDDGCVLIHPRWLLERFLEVAEEHVADVLVAPSQSSLRRNALNYVRGLLDEPPIA